ncbi:MAG TPA: hypothetical protein VNO22_11540 [Planctomycetota bacterium]|nr:hypothetical protein [Planctomycetota bacterium]
MRSWSGRAAILTALVTLAPAGADPAQERVHHPDYRKCKICAPAWAKAMSYLKANLRSDTARRVIGSKMGGYMMGGFAFLMDGQSPKELEECIQYACQAIKDEGFNRNWYLSMSMIFLAEVALRTGLTPEIEKALAHGLKMAERQQEETGGWCHHRLFWKESGYNQKGGGRDLGMITAMMYGAFLELTALGVTVGPMMERARKNLESISDGMGVRYGTDNGVGDAAMARASWVLSSLLATGQTTHPFFAKYSKGLEQRYKKIEEGVHGFAPLHYFSVAAAMHRLGPDFYAKFIEEYLDRLIATQTPEGIVPLHQEDDVASTAVFACIVMMQKPGIFRPALKKKGKPAAEKNPAPPSPPSPTKARAADPQTPAVRDSLLAGRVRDADAMTPETDGSPLDVAGSNLKLAGRRHPAVALAEPGDSGALPPAAFHLPARGEEAAAEEAMRRLPAPEADRTRSAFPIP